MVSFGPPTLHRTPHYHSETAYIRVLSANSLQREVRDVFVGFSDGGLCIPGLAAHSTYHGTFMADYSFRFSAALACAGGKHVERLAVLYSLVQYVLRGHGATAC